MEQFGAGAPSLALNARVIAFLENRFQVSPDVSAMTGRVIETSRW